MFKFEVILITYIEQVYSLNPLQVAGFDPELTSCAYTEIADEALSKDTDLSL